MHFLDIMNGQQEQQKLLAVNHLRSNEMTINLAIFGWRHIGNESVAAGVRTDTTIASTGPSSIMDHGTPQLKVSVPAGANTVKASFDPVSAEDARLTRLLNKTLELGYEPPLSSTR
jgi:hypothetical protein